MKTETRVGLTFLLGALLLYLSIAWLRNSQFFSKEIDYYTLEAPDVKGLKKGDAVTVLGIPSGRVESFKISDQKVLINISLDTGIELMQDATAKISMKELLGGKYIEIEPGSSPTLLISTMRIPTSNAPDIASALADMGNIMKGLDGEKIAHVFIGVDQLVKNLNLLSEQIQTIDLKTAGQNLEDGLGGVNNILNNIGNRHLIEKSDSLISIILLLSGQLGNSLTQVDRIMAKVENTTLTKTDSLLTQLNTISGYVNENMAEMELLIGNLNSKNTMAGKFLSDPDFAKRMEEIAENFDKTLDHIRRKKIHVSMSLSHRQKVEYSDSLNPR